VSAESGARIERGRWHLTLAPALAELPPRLAMELVERAIEVERSGETPLRRSRHATTYQIRLGTRLSGQTDIFVKLLDAPRGLKLIRHLLLRSRAERMRTILSALATAGFAIAPLMFVGEEQHGGRTIMVTARVSGEPLPRWLRNRSGAPRSRFALMRALGEEVARLHRAGFIHGDLTPYNIFVSRDARARFSFIDHERTARPRLNWERRRLRNLVQLCRFDLPGMSRTDRMRIVHSYSRAVGEEPGRLVRRVERMLRARHVRDILREA
jgi:serine/threonine protein kinase